LRRTNVKPWLAAASAAVLSALGIAVFVPWSSGTSAATTLTESSAGCTVRLHFTPADHPTQVTADILSGCEGTDFYLVSHVGQSDTFATSKPQYVYSWTGKAPWVVPLPGCFWQADFVEAKNPPLIGQHLSVEHFVAGKLGGTACRTPPATTGMTTTTVGVTTTSLGTTSTTLQTATTTVHPTSKTAPTSTPPSTGVPRSVTPSGSASTTSTSTVQGASQSGSTTPVQALVAADPSSSRGAGSLAFTGAVAMRGMIILGLLLAIAGLFIARAGRSRQGARD
jgi:hypothetical protein